MERRSHRFAQMDQGLGRGRRLIVRIFALIGLILFILFFGMLSVEAMGLVDASPRGSPRDPPPSPQAKLGAAHPGEAVHIVGALGVLTLGGSGLIAIAHRPERRWAAYLVMATTGAILMSVPLVGNPDNYGGQAGAFDPVLVVVVLPSAIAALLAAPWRRAKTTGRFRRSLLLLTAVVAIPAAWYGVTQAFMQRYTFPPVADPHHNGHWWSMGILAFAVVLVSAMAAAPDGSRPVGSALAGTATLAVGVTSLVDPSAASALPSGWAIAAVTWGGAAIGVTLASGANTDTDRGAVGRTDQDPGRSSRSG